MKIHITADITITIAPQPKAASKPRTPPMRFMPPTVEEVREYCNEKGYKIDPAQFVDFYNANGWVQGRQGKPLKDWKAAASYWDRSGYGSGGVKQRTIDDWEG